MKSSRYKRSIQLKKARRFRNKSSRRFWAVRAHKQGRKILPQLLKEFGL